MWGHMTLKMPPTTLYLPTWVVKFYTLDFFYKLGSLRKKVENHCSLVLAVDIICANDLFFLHCKLPMMSSMCCDFTQEHCLLLIFL